MHVPISELTSTCTMMMKLSIALALFFLSGSNGFHIPSPSLAKHLFSSPAPMLTKQVPSLPPISTPVLSSRWLHKSWKKSLKSWILSYGNNIKPSLVSLVIVGLECHGRRQEEHRRDALRRSAGANQAFLGQHLEQ